MSIMRSVASEGEQGARRVVYERWRKPFYAIVGVTLVSYGWYESLWAVKKKKKKKSLHSRLQLAITAAGTHVRIERARMLLFLNPIYPESAYKQN